MALPRNKTKIVATIGPTSESPEMLELLIRAGLNVARLNFSHGDLVDHAERIKRIRSAAEAVGRRVAIMADLPGPKVRIGRIEPDPIHLHAGESFILTTEEIAGTPQRVSVSFKDLPAVVRPGDRLFLNDGLVQLTVERVAQVHSQDVGRWRTAFQKGPEFARNRSRAQPLYRARPYLSGICVATGSGRREPVVRGDWS